MFKFISDNDYQQIRKQPDYKSVINSIDAVMSNDPTIVDHFAQCIALEFLLIESRNDISAVLTDDHIISLDLVIQASFRLFKEKLKYDKDDYGSLVIDLTHVKCKLAVLHACLSIRPHCVIVKIEDKKHYFTKSTDASQLKEIRYFYSLTENPKVFL